MTDPASKYRDKLDPRHQQAMDTVFIARELIGRHRAHFEELLASERQAHSVGHILDPTLYRDMIQSKAFALQLRAIRATVAFLDELDAVHKEMLPATEPPADRDHVI